jgi:signal transduction histidine kinase
MVRLTSTRLQTALVVFLFLASLALLVVNGAWPLVLPSRERQARTTLREAGRRLAEEAAPVAADLAGDERPSFGEAARRLRAASERALADYPGVEGGFYLAESDGFAGHAFPTEESAPRNEPPPKEAPVIRGLAQQSLSLPPGELLASVQDVGPSRVAFVTLPVGDRRPAPLAAWVMFRVVRPEEAEARLPGYVASSALALAGIAVALLLTWNLAGTLRRQREEEGRLRDELRHSAHLATLGRLLAGVAHEVRNPLAAIRSTVQLWQRLPDAARTPAALEAVVAAVDRLNAIVSRLLYFARADSAERRRVDLGALFGEALDLIQAQAAGQGVTLERDFAADLPPVNGSANALRQVALNLLTNALQAMPKGGRLRCATRPGLRPGTVEARVGDTGPGVSPEDRIHLFEPFFTTRPDGTGLGLALCREVVAGHGGDIRLDESAAPGATFVVVLPAAGEGPP